ncbi:MAG: UvrB/UvrC motif-containing protein [Clostridioides sp.]|nr:UvrB/UvrC motif-containing protein [Clostridioides sp.]
MLCQICKNKEAVVYYNELINGQERELYLCTECAKKYTDFSIDIPSSVMNIASQLGLQEEEESKSQLKCPVCGMGYSDFRKTGLFGCSSCYDTFRDQIDPMIKSIHGQTEHIGKVPKESLAEINIQSELKKLKEDLDIAIISERYEQAAVIRDKIKNIEETHEILK